MQSSNFKINVRDNGLVEFLLVNPIAANPNMSVDVSELARITCLVEKQLTDLEIQTNAALTKSFRKKSDGTFELYMLTAAVPGTVQMRHGKKGWPPRKKK